MLQQQLEIIVHMQSEYSVEEQDYRHISQAKAKYSKTSMKKKAQLVDLVSNQHWSIYKASKKLKLSNSTAKSILRNFQKYGTLLQKFTKNRILKLREIERSEQTTPKVAPTPKEEENTEKVIVKEEPWADDGYQQENLDNNGTFYPFIAYPYPLYFGFPHA